MIKISPAMHTRIMIRSRLLSPCSSTRGVQCELEATGVSSLAMSRQVQPSIQTRRRRNPTWGKPIIVAPRSLTEFEMEVSRLQLTKERYLFSDELRGWCRKNRNRIYVPEWLLETWHIVVDVNFDWFLTSEKSHKARLKAGADVDVTTEDSSATMKKAG